MEEAIKGATTLICIALLSSDSDAKRAEQIKAALESLWLTAQEDVSKNKRPLVIKMDN